jgi:hypothetical protein
VKPADFTGVLVGTLKHGEASVVQPAPGILLKVEEPLELTVDSGAGKLARGGKLTLKITVKRNPALAGAVALTVDNLPRGITAAPAAISADSNTVELVLSAAQDAQVGTVRNVAIKGEVTAENRKFSAESSAMTLVVE